MANNRLQFWTSYIAGWLYSYCFPLGTVAKFPVACYNPESHQFSDIHCSLTETPYQMTTIIRETLGLGKLQEYLMFT